MRIAVICATLILLNVSSSANAQNNSAEIDAFITRSLGTTGVVFHKSAVAGVIVGCGLEFTAIGRDIEAGGQPYKINGSYYLRTDKANLHTLLKLGVFDYGSDRSRQPRPFAPPRAFVAAKNGQAVTPLMSLASDNPAYSLHIFEINEAFKSVWAGIFDNKHLEVSFSRAAGKQDTISLIDLRVKSSRFIGGEIVRETSDEMVRSLGECSSQLLNAYKAGAYDERPKK